MKAFKFSALLLFVSTCLYAQTTPPQDAATIQQNLHGLDVLGSVLYVAAHPDDENTRLLAYLAKEKHYRTGYLSLTRGDGGQNLIGNEQGELLGLIRTQELLAARRVDGAEQFFSRAIDFGFSKTPEETMKIWDREKVLSDAVWVIRKFRPDVMICRFPTTGEGGHGHHTTSAILAKEAFSAAADPKRFPEQLKYVQVWQAKRLLWNTFNFGGTNLTAPDQFKLDVGVYNPVLGKGYGEIAAQSRSNHKSQGFGSASQRGEFFEYFKTILGDAPTTDLFDGVNTTWARVGNASVDKDIQAILKAFNAEHPEKSVPALIKLLDKVENIKDEYWREQKGKQLKDIIAACAGLWFESYAEKATYAVGETIQVSSQMINRTDSSTRLANIGIDNSITGFRSGAGLPAGQLKTFSSTPVAKTLTQPYWLTLPHNIGMYVLPADSLAGNPENPYQAKVTYDILINGRDLQYERNVVYKYTDPVRGELYQPIEITPPVTANIEQGTYLFKAHQPQTVRVKLKSFTNGSGSVSLKPLAGWKFSPEKVEFTKATGDEWTAAFTVTPTSSNPNISVLEAVVDAGGKQWSMGLQRIKYEHIPNITIFPPSQAKLVYADLKTGGKNIGYITGAGDRVPDALRQAGYNVHLLNEDEVMNGDLSVYDAIVTGVRAYNVNERLAYEQPNLLEYVKNGGTLLLQYNNPGKLVTNNLGPYPFSPVNQRVTEEDAKVTITEPNSPALNYPNKITDTDFAGWVQERGLYFVSNVDPKYSTPLQINDTGMAPDKGSLILADYGKGRFVYTSLAFFRQLPAGVPGAYRLFANLLAKAGK